MLLYDIDNQIINLIESSVDEETGELVDEAALQKLESLKIERESEIENLACYYKNMIAEANAIKQEVDVLKKRQHNAESKAERAKQILQLSLNGEKFKSAKAQITYRKTSITVAGTEFVEWAKKSGRDDLLTYKEPVPSLRAVKQAIENGEKIEGASVETNYTIQIK